MENLIENLIIAAIIIITVLLVLICVSVFEKINSKNKKNQNCLDFNFEQWFNIVFIAASKQTQQHSEMQKDGQQFFYDFVAYFDLGLFCIFLMTENHEFEKYCFSHLKTVLSESPKPDSFPEFIKLYNRIIDVYNECMKTQEDAGLFGKAIAESIVDYFYKDGDSLELSCCKVNDYYEYMLRFVHAFKDQYKNK